MLVERARQITKKVRRRVVYAVAGTTLVGASALGAEHVASPHADDISAIMRETIGTDNTIRLEGVYFDIKDKKNRLADKIFGGEPKNPFGKTTEEVQFQTTDSKDPIVLFYDDYTSRLNRLPLIVEPPKPAPLTLPEINLIQQPIPGEGVWTTDGLPHSSPDDILMAKSIIRPDVSRPRSILGMLVVDKRRIDLHMVAGTESPGGDLGIPGPGKIPENDLSNLLVAWKGGFLGPDGDYGMYADGKTYRPLVDGLASVAVTQNGEILMGEWGRSLAWRDDMIAVRQNAILLVDNCEVTKLAAERPADTRLWGRVWLNSTEFITWRSAIGLTKNGDLIVAAGNDISAGTLAIGLQAAGACTAMQLDINNPQVLISLFDHQPNGSLTASKFMSTMTESNEMRYINTTQKHDIMYLTLRGQ